MFHDTTVFRDNVFASLQHAFFACLLSFSGSTTDLQYRFYPNGTHSPPFMVIDNPISVGLDLDNGMKLSVHMMVSEPSHGQLLQFASQLRRLGYHKCMLLLGTIKPVNLVKQSSVSEIRGLLLHLDVLLPANDGTSAYPPTALEHGWKVCFNTNDTTLCFALNGQRTTDNGMEVLQQATLPSLSTIGLRMWRRGDVAHALMPKNMPYAPHEWDTSIKRFLETLVE
jgi:hypothetical protein